MNRLLKKIKYCDISISFTREEIALLNRALCLYGNVIDNINMFCEHDDNFSLEDKDDTINLMEKIGEEL